MASFICHDVLLHLSKCMYTHGWKKIYMTWKNKNTNRKYFALNAVTITLSITSLSLESFSSFAFWNNAMKVCSLQLYYPTTPAYGEYSHVIQGCNNFFIFPSLKSIQLCPVSVRIYHHTQKLLFKIWYQCCNFKIKNIYSILI